MYHDPYVLEAHVREHIARIEREARVHAALAAANGQRPAPWRPRRWWQRAPAPGPAASTVSAHGEHRDRETGTSPLTSPPVTPLAIGARASTAC